MDLWKVIFGMIEKKFIIENSHGLHARPAAQLVRLASQFGSDIFIIKDGMEVNGKSIMGVMMLAAEVGSEISIRVQGSDEADAIEALGDLFENKFGEG